MQEFDAVTRMSLLVAFASRDRSALVRAITTGNLLQGRTGEDEGSDG
jgi:hypothetical protein